VLVQVHEYVDQFATNGPAPEQAWKLGQVNQPLRIPGSPVIVGPVDDAEDPVAGNAIKLGAPRRLS
jgi:hypothetical protein